MTDTSITERLAEANIWFEPIDRVLRWAAENGLRAEAIEAHDTLAELAGGFHRLSAERDKLRAALEPFAAMAEALSDWPAGDDQPPFYRPVITRDASGRRETRFVCLTIADLRRAASALAPPMRADDRATGTPI